MNVLESGESILQDTPGLRGWEGQEAHRQRRDGRLVTAVLTWQRGELARFSLLNAGE